MTTTIDTHIPTSPDGDVGQRERADWEIAGEAWEHAAADWAYRFEPHARDVIDDVFAVLGVGSDVRLLDVACGSGYALGVAERAGARCSGIDASRALVDIAARRAPNADLVAGSMFDLPWADETFDAVTSFNGIWGGCQGAIDEAFRVLRPGGSIAVSFWGPGRALALRDYFIALGNSAPGVEEELKDLASIGAPGVSEGMLESAGFVVDRRDSASGVIEASDDDDIYRVLRSPGAALPAIEHVGDDELRTRVLSAVARYRAPDGSYRLVNEVTYVVGHKPR